MGMDGGLYVLYLMIPLKKWGKGKEVTLRWVLGISIASNPSSAPSSLSIFKLPWPQPPSASSTSPQVHERFLLKMILTEPTRAGGVWLFAYNAQIKSFPYLHPYLPLDSITPLCIKLLSLNNRLVMPCDQDSLFLRPNERLGIDCKV